MFAQTTPIHVRDVALRVRNLTGMTQYYQAMLGLEEIERSAGHVGLGAGGVVLLRLEHRPDAPLSAPSQAGLFHTAFLMPTRADLARWLVHVAMASIPMTGFSDHRVSEAIYLDDPEGNGIEVYADRAPELWSWDGDKVVMGTEQLDVDGLVALADVNADTYHGAPAGLRIGHVHLRAGQIDRAAAFYNALLGLDITAGMDSAVFLSSGRYHHHLALNTWQSAGAGLRDNSTTGLDRFSLSVTDDALLAAIRGRLSAAGLETTEVEGGFSAIDPWGTVLQLVAA